MKNFYTDSMREGEVCEFSIKRSFVLTYWLYLHVEQQTIRKR